MQRFLDLLFEVHERTAVDLAQILLLKSFRFHSQYSNVSHSDQDLVNNNLTAEWSWMQQSALKRYVFSFHFNMFSDRLIGSIEVHDDSFRCRLKSCSCG